MKILVINGTEKHGVTYRLKEIFLEQFRGKASITKYIDGKYWAEQGWLGKTRPWRT